MSGKEKERNQQQTRSSISGQHTEQQGMCHISKSSGLPYFSFCCEAQAGQTQGESRSKHDAAIGAGKLRGNTSQECEVTHRVHWGTPYEIKKKTKTTTKTTTAGYTMHGNPRQFNLEAYKCFTASYLHGEAAPFPGRRAERAASSSQQ